MDLETLTQKEEIKFSPFSEVEMEVNTQLND